MTTQKKSAKKTVARKSPPKQTPAKQVLIKPMAQETSEAMVRPHLFDATIQAATEFGGILYVSSGQSSLDGTLIVKDGSGDFADAMTAAAAYFTENGFQSGIQTFVDGRSSVAHLSEHPINVIVMTNAHQ